MGNAISNCPDCGVELLAIEDHDSYYACPNCGRQVALPEDMKWIEEIKKSGAVSRCQCTEAAHYFEYREMESNQVQRIIYGCKNCQQILAVKEFVIVKEKNGHVRVEKKE